MEEDKILVVIHAHYEEIVDDILDSHYLDDWMVIGTDIVTNIEEARLEDMKNSGYEFEYGYLKEA